MLSAGASWGEGLTSIEVSSDEPELATAAVKSLSVQFPGAEVQAVTPPDDRVVRVLIRRIDARRVLITVSRGAQSSSRELDIENSASALELGESVALTVPELLSGLKAPKRAAVAPPVSRPSVVAPLPSAVEPLPSEPLPQAAPSPTRALVPSTSYVPPPRAQLVLGLSAGTMLAPRPLPGAEVGVSFRTPAGIALGLSSGFFWDGPDDRPAGALLPVGVLVGFSLWSEAWAIRTELGPELVLLLWGGQADMLPAVKAGLCVSRRVTPGLALGVGIAALAIPSSPQVLGPHGRPLAVSPVLVGLRLELQWQSSP